MLTAELYGKLSELASAGERREDVLTSHVFGLFRYFDATATLSELLGRARNTLGERLDLPGIRRMEVFLWPTIVVGSFTRQPDAALRLTHEDGSRSLIVVEAKYESGPSDAEDAADGSGATGAQMPGNQLAAYYLGAREGSWRVREAWGEAPAGTEAQRVVVLYITSHHAVPIDVLRQAVGVVEETGVGSGAQGAIYWVGWRDLTEVLDTSGESDVPRPGEWRFRQDLLGVLRLRRLEPFHGVFRALMAPGIYPGLTIERGRWSGLTPVDEYVRWFQV